MRFILSLNRVFKEHFDNTMFKVCVCGYKMNLSNGGSIHGYLQFIFTSIVGFDVSI